MNILITLFSGVNCTINENDFWTTDRTLVCLAIIISILSLVTAFLFNRKTLNITIEHNKKTISPAITCDRMISLNEGSANLEISNSGFGPAIIKKINFVYDEKKYDRICELIEKNVSIFQYALLQKGSIETKIDHREVLAAGKNLEIYILKFPKGFDITTIKTVLCNTKLVIEYEDLYDNHFEKNINIH